jgi:DNA repair exonuclease SbcCD ATPase subunit/DNA repair exonuclease SbcCD nuclease subunit
VFLKIAHIADTHIRNYKYHREYRAVFDQIYDKLKEEKVDYIVHCGDLAHTKTQLSPEYFDLATSFLKNLADIAPTYIILGNHDGNLKNEHRQDAITPIANALRHPNLNLLKNAGETVVTGNIAFNVLSVFDEENWVAPSSNKRINIALYHGSVSGVKTDTGWVMTHGDHPITIFKGHDYVLLGDIHKTNQILDEEGRVRYPGSTVQQNFGETDDKGFLLWDIQSKEDFTCKHIVIQNPKPFITINLTPTGRMPKGLSVKKGARLRLVSNNNLSLEAMRKAIDVAKQRFKPDTITFLNRAAGQRGNVEEITDSIQQDDMRNPQIQEELIREYLVDYQATEELMKKVLDLNTLYVKKAEETEEVSRNIKWRINDLQWDNLFNYGDGNRVDFSKLNGTVGIFGKNYSGKSSVIDSLLYTLFNTTSKNERKNVNIINQNRSEGSGEVVITIGDEQYYVRRASSKYTKRLKGVETLEAKTDLDFFKIDRNGEKVSLNGLTRNETDKNIRKVFGSLDDFLLTSLSSQLDSLSFIREGSTKRKEILAKFLDLEIFEKKFKLAKEDASDMRGALKRLEGRDYDTEIEEAEQEHIECEQELDDQKIVCADLRQEVLDLRSSITAIEGKIESIPAEMIDIVRVKSDIRQRRLDLATAQKNLEQDKADLKGKKKLVKNIDKFLIGYDIADLESKERRSDKISADIADLDKEMTQLEKKVASLDDPGFLRGCKCLHEAEEALVQKPNLTQKITNLIQELKDFDTPKLKKSLEQYYSLSEKKSQTSRGITTTELAIARNQNTINHLANELSSLKEKETSYEDNREAIENLEALLAEKDVLLVGISNKESKLQACKDKIVRHHRHVGSLEQKVINIRDQKNDYLELREQFAAYDLYMRAMHPNGIAYDVIKKKLPVINQEIAKVLTNLTNFEVLFEEDGNKLDILIKHPKHDPRPLSMASGAEKTMAAMAIRLAFLAVSNLPTSDIMVLDEPGTALDEEHLQAFTQLLDMIKVHFKTTLLISHLDSLKDVVDLTLDISKKDGYAYINQ